jgi:hypothetical protein
MSGPPGKRGRGYAGFFRHWQGAILLKISEIVRRVVFK